MFKPKTERANLPIGRRGQVNMVLEGSKCDKIEELCREYGISKTTLIRQMINYCLESMECST